MYNIMPWFMSALFTDLHIYTINFFFLLFLLLVAASQIWSAVSNIPPLEILKIKAMAVKLKTDLNIMVQEIKVNIAMADFTPNDYNPPRLDIIMGFLTCVDASLCFKLFCIGSVSTF